MLGPGSIILRCAKLIAKALSKPCNLSQLAQLLVNTAATCDQGNRRHDSFQPGMLDPVLPKLFSQSLRTRTCFPVGGVALLPFLDRQLLPLQLFLRILDLGKCLVDFRVLGPRPEEIIKALVQSLLCLTQARDPRTRREEQFAQGALARANFLPGLRQSFVIDPEERLETFPGSSLPGTGAAMRPQ